MKWKWNRLVAEDQDLQGGAKPVISQGQVREVSQVVSQKLPARREVKVKEAVLPQKEP